MLGPALTVLIGSEALQLAASSAWELRLAGGRLVLREVVEPQALQNGPALGVFVFMGRWVFDPTDDGSGRVAFDGDPIQSVAYLSASDPVRVSVVVTSTASETIAEPLSSPLALSGTPCFEGRSHPLVIGRSGLRADVELDDPTVASRHATAERNPEGSWTVRRHRGQVWVDGRSVEFAVLLPGDRFVVGQTTLLISSDAPPAPVTTPLGRRGASVDAVNFSAAYPNRLALDRANVHIDADEFVAVVGPSGAGKTSMVKALLGGVSARGGSLTIDGVEVGGPDHRRLLRQMVRYVPQGDDSLHLNLTVQETLNGGARLRMSPDVSRQERDAQVNDVLAQMKLTQRSGALVGSLSGGERRRVSIGLELLAHPRLLLLDEPTSGLDQGKDRQVMRVLQSVAKSGCTVICVTHAVDHLVLADRIIVMAAEGMIAYAGDPLVALTTIGAPTWADAMTSLAEEPLRYGEQYRARCAMFTAVRESRTAVDLRRERPRLKFTGLGTLLKRQSILVARRGTRSLAALAALPIGGTLIAVVASSSGLAPGPDSKATAVLAITATVAALTGISLTYIDLLSEQQALKRDWRVGVPAGLIVLSKALVFGVIALFLAILMFLVFALSRGLPAAGPTGVPSVLAVALPWAGIVLASMALGLWLSTLAPSFERAVTLAAGVTILQVVFNGTVFELPKALKFASVALPARLGLASGAAWTGAGEMRRNVPGAYHDPLWDQTTAHVWMPLVGLVVLTVTYVVLAGLQVSRRWEESE